MKRIPVLIFKVEDAQQIIGLLISGIQLDAFSQDLHCFLFGFLGKGLEIFYPGLALPLSCNVVPWTPCPSLSMALFYLSVIGNHTPRTYLYY